MKHMKHANHFTLQPFVKNWVKKLEAFFSPKNVRCTASRSTKPNGPR